MRNQVGMIELRKKVQRGTCVRDKGEQEEKKMM